MSRASFDPAAWAGHAPEVEFMLDWAWDTGWELHTLPVAARRSTVSRMNGDTQPEVTVDAGIAFHEAVRGRFPDDGVISEEFGEPRARTWTIHVDGASHYQVGLPMWGIGLALVVDGEPVVGAVHFPETGTCYLASTERPGAYRNGRRIPVIHGRPRHLAGAQGELVRGPTIHDPLIVAAVETGDRLWLDTGLEAIPPLLRARGVIEGGLLGTIVPDRAPRVVAPLVPIARALGLNVTAIDGSQQRYDGQTNGAVISIDAPCHAALIARWAFEQELREVPIDELGLSPAACNRLLRARIYTLQDLTRLTANDIRAISDAARIGLLDEVQRKLASRGLGLRGSER